jgi:RHS repeat-associated protein
MKNAIDNLFHSHSATDYYPFGMGMPERSWSAGEYRFGFNGKEMDNEVKGEGNQLDYGMRIYDTRIGKFLSIDPLVNRQHNLDKI